jgi:tellurite resistance protein TerC
VGTGFVLIAAVTVAAGLAAEMLFFAREREPRRREAIVWSVGWLGLAAAVAGGLVLSGESAGPWTTVYLIERSLSLDNVFVFSLLLASLSVPAELRGRVVAIGVAGALILRGAAILAGLALIEAIEPVVYVFGVALLYVSYRAFRGGAEDGDPTDNPLLGRVRRVLPTTPDFRGTRLLVREEGRLRGTPLLVTVFAIILADIAFAVDSIPAALSVTRDATVIWTANAFALLGLGALLALVAILVRRFRFLDKTIALILAFVGVNILLTDVADISDAASLAVIVGLLAAGVVASLLADRYRPPTLAEAEIRRPPRCGGAAPAASSRDGRGAPVG